MNPSEFIEGLSAIYANTMAATVVFLSVLSGYMVVAYTAGKDLTPAQAHFISALFVVFAGIFALGGFLFNLGAIDFINEFGSEPAAGITIYNGYVILAVSLIAIVGAVFFMYEIRKRISAKTSTENERDDT